MDSGGVYPRESRPLDFGLFFSPGGTSLGREGNPTLLISNGQIIPEHLAKEVITEAELRTSLRRQGFETLSEVRAAILETSGNLTVVRQHPTTDEDNQKDLIDRLDRIELALSQLTQRLDPSC